ncbi:hypothetical protein [Ruania halotolerans]|uniref:hypothetical protein n=1 Tax=Ruania halotolerans TaxID=2897773 RepID=UPI001E5DE3C7|nr:hypothetical protein [Ruania halotolerans]UFU07650.1 hypothetical protein LQF10_05985 [Ruania halotolerans]
MPEPTFLNDRYIRTEAVLALIARVLRRLLVVAGVVGVLAAGLGLLVAGVAGLWAALLAAGISLVFTGATVLAMHLVAGRGPELLQIVLIGGWLVKMALLAVALLWLREQDFYHREIFIGALFIAVAASAVVEVVTIATARLPYVSPTAEVAETSQPDEAEATSPSEASRAPESTGTAPPAGAADAGSAEPSPSHERHNPPA